MALIIGACLLADALMHKGLVRVMLPVSFPPHLGDTGFAKNGNVLINTGKEWVQAVNTIERMNRVNENCNGVECDVYFMMNTGNFDVHHDADDPTGLNLDSLLAAHHARGLKASIWLDFKNLEVANQTASLAELVRLRNKYGLRNRVLVESPQPGLLQPFSDSGFYTAYYTPSFNPYFCTDDSLRHWVDRISAQLSHSTVSALSGYYFQYPFLHRYFPNYPLLVWSPGDRFSLVNWLYKKRIASQRTVSIALYP